MANKPVDVFKSINMHDGDTDQCWEWTGSLGGRDKRPYFTANGERALAYRIVYVLFHGQPIPDGHVVRHKCDNQICCNPHHLELGTQQENIKDTTERDRAGVNKTMRAAIKKARENGTSIEQIAEITGVSVTTVKNILNDRWHK